MYGDLNDCYGAPLQRELAEMNRLEQELIETGNREAETYYAEMAEREKNMNDKTAFGKVIATCDNCRKLIYEGDMHYYARYQQGEFCLCDHCVTVINPEPQVTVDDVPTVEAVPIKAISVWLAGYAAPPNYALDEITEDIDPTGIVYTANDRAMAWEYHLKHLMECGLLQEEQDGTDNP